jgi:predicted amidophosphoribosyltransferase
MVSADPEHPVAANAIERVEATETQTHKNRVERWLNMQHRFKLNDETFLEGKHILLVDDVITTELH